MTNSWLNSSFNSLSAFITLEVIELLFFNAQIQTFLQWYAGHDLFVLFLEFPVCDILSVFSWLIKFWFAPLRMHLNTSKQINDPLYALSWIRWNLMFTICIGTILFFLDIFVQKVYFKNAECALASLTANQFQPA